MTLFYYMYLIISEKAITSKKTADSGEKKDQ
jgi:hypothetical protein